VGGGVPLSPMSAITEWKVYSRKYTIEYIANSRNKYWNTKCVYMKVFILGFFFVLNSFLTIKPSQWLNTSKNSQLYTAKFYPLCRKYVLSWSVITRVYCILISISSWNILFNPCCSLAHTQVVFNNQKILSNFFYGQWLIWLSLHPCIVIYNSLSTLGCWCWFGSWVSCYCFNQQAGACMGSIPQNWSPTKREKEKYILAYPNYDLHDSCVKHTNPWPY
jgi:hypothetical protein